MLGRLNKRRNQMAGKPGPASRYDTPELVEALRTIWMASDQLCSKRLKAALPLWLPHYGASFHPLSADIASYSADGFFDFLTFHKQNRAA
ncbi:MAG: hypothetical protein Q7S46_06790 [Gallionella sp.]|nr:hypothetical protein [Gallionella sp.]